MDITPEPPTRTLILVLHVRRDADGHLRGWIEHPRTRAKEAFDGLPAAADVIGTLVDLSLPGGEPLGSRSADDRAERAPPIAPRQATPRPGARRRSRASKRP